MGGSTPPCLLTVALSSVLILIISKQLPWLWREDPNGSRAVCMVTAMLELRVGQHPRCAWWPDSFRWTAGAVDLSSEFSVLLEGRGGRAKRCDVPKRGCLPDCGFHSGVTGFVACLHILIAVFLSSFSSLFSTGVLLNAVILSSSCREMSDCDLRWGDRSKSPWSKASLTCAQYTSACLWTRSWVMSEPEQIITQ